MHPADPLPEEGSPTDAGPQEDSSSDTSAPGSDAKLDTTSELPFGADQPGFTDWRVELRERLKRIRARRESEQEEAEAAAAARLDEVVDESEAPTIDDLGIDSGDTVEVPVEDALTDLDQTLEQPDAEDMVELSEILGGPDLPLQTDAEAAEIDTREVTEQVVATVVEESTADLDELLEDEPPAETAAELLGGAIIDAAETESSAEKPAGRATGGAAGTAAAGKATSGWDGDLIADLQAVSAEPQAADLIAESLDPLADVELSATESPELLVDAPEAEEESLAGAEEISTEELAIVEDTAVADVEPEVVEAGDSEVESFWGLDDEGLRSDAAKDVVLVEEPTEDTIPEVAEDVAEEDEALGEIPVETEEAPGAKSSEAAPAFAAARVGDPPGFEVAEIESVEIEAAEIDVRELEFDEVGEAVVEPAPDLELDIEGTSASEYDAGLEWDAPAPPELLRPSTSGLDPSAAPLGQRAVAGIADALVLVTIAGVLVGAASSAAGATYEELLTDALLPLAVAWGIFAFGYLVFFTGTCGQTVGKMIMKLRVVSTDQLSVGFGRATKRLVASVPSILVLGIGFFSALRDPKRRTIYDRVAQTRVVKA